MLTITHRLSLIRVLVRWSKGFHALLAVALLNSASGAQISNAATSRPAFADSSVSAIMRLARRGGFPAAAAIEILRQGAQVSSQARPRELADSLTGLAIGLPGGAISAVSAIKGWGAPDPNLGGQPDAAALGYLIRISRDAGDRETRAAAIRGMIFQINPSRALPYLSEVAASARVDEALSAVVALNRLAFSGTIGTPNERAAAATALRQLYDVGAMKSGGAISVLCDVAASQRWPRNAMCAGRA